MRSKVGGRDTVSIQEKVRLLLQATFPSFWDIKTIAMQLGLSDNYQAVAKGCERLLKSSRIQRPSRAKRGFYQGIPTPENVAGLEDPPVKIHALTYHIELQKLDFDKVRGSPCSLYTDSTTIKSRAREKKYNKNSSKTWHEATEYWTLNSYSYKVTVQFHKESISVHIHSSKEPLDEINYLVWKSWLYGLLKGYGVNTDLMDLRIVKAELNKDYTKISISPKELLIRDLEKGSYLRLYRKYRNLHRLEIGTTWEGDKELYELFKQFGSGAKSHPPTPLGDDLGGMFQ